MHLFRKLATKPEYVTPAHSSYEELEELFWKELLNDKSLPPIYGADVCDSITDKVSLQMVAAWWKRRLFRMILE